MPQQEAKILLGKQNKAKKLKRNEAKWSEKIGPLFSLEHAKTKRNGSCFVSFRFEAKKYFMRNRRTLGLTLFIPNIKQRCFIREWGRGERHFFYGLAIDYRANILYRDLTVFTSRLPKQEAFWRDTSPTTYVIIGSLWRHHQTKLPLARMFTNTCSLSFRYMISMP
jgi:hypothetical protein